MALILQSILSLQTLVVFGGIIFILRVSDIRRNEITVTRDSDSDKDGDSGSDGDINSGSDRDRAVPHIVKQLDSGAMRQLDI